jgi:GNAT superfamily N-acetyltransferase
MSTSFTLRDMLPSDGPALKRLMENDPETADMSLTTRFQIDAYRAWTALKPNLAGVVAEALDTNEIVEAATVSFEDIQFEGDVLPSAFLENLKVHHAYRGQGLGSKLARWRIDRARQHFGEKGVILTGTTSDNTASQTVLKKWCKQFFGPLKVTPCSPLLNLPKPPTGITVRATEGRDLAEIAEKSNRFYANYNLYAPLSAEKLEATLKIEPQGNHYRVVVNSSGAITAGAMMSERAILMVDEFRNVPPPLRVINRFAHIILADNRQRLMEVGHFWFDDLASARYLWDSIRWEFRERASSVSIGYDPRGPFKDVVSIKPWHMPKIDIVIAINGPTIMGSHRLVANVLRG